MAKAIACGNCKGTHNSAAEVKVCFSQKVEKVFTVKCRWTSCETTKTGTRSELAGWQYCDDHKGSQKSNRLAEPSTVAGSVHVSREQTIAVLSDLLDQMGNMPNSKAKQYVSDMLAELLSD